MTVDWLGAPEVRCVPSTPDTEDNGRVHGFKKILVVLVDDSAASEELVREAASVAHRGGADITVAQVIEPLPDLVASHVPGRSKIDLQERMVAERFHRLSAWSRSLLDARVEQSTSVVLVGTAFLEIIARVEEEEHDLVVLVGEPPARSGRLSSTALHLLRKSPVPVWVVRARRRRSIVRIGAALADDDGNPLTAELNQLILSHALSFARRREAEVTAVHAWHVADEEVLRSAAGLSRSEADALVSAVRHDAKAWLHGVLGEVDQGQVRLRAALVKGPAGRQLPQFVARHRLDLLVFGTVGRIDIPGLIMSEEAEDIAQQSDCDLLALKPPGFVSPVSGSR